MPHGKTKFQDIWLEKELDGVLLKEWCCVSTNNTYFARCNLCVERFDISSGGFSQVKSHHKGKKHKIKFDSRFKNKSTISQAFSQNNNCNTENALSHDMQIYKAETLWALRVAESNMSFKSCNETVELFKEMFPDSIIASEMQLKEKKVAYVICHGIYKNFQELLKKDISSCCTKFTIAFDETTNAQVKRQLDVYARYWSGDLNIVSCRYLTSVFLGHATADIILKELLDVLSYFNISLDNIICLSMDNPNVNKCLLRKFNERMRNECGKETVSLGACNLHVANNSFKHLLHALDVVSFDEFATDVHFFLKYSAARREDYQCIEEVTQETAKFFLKHVSSRWLTIGPVAQRLLDQWGNLCEYFLKFLPSQKSQEKHLNTDRYKRIHAALKNPVMPSFLAFLIFTHKYFENFSLCFQSESPKIHVLYEEINNLIRSVMTQVLKDSVVAKKEGNDLEVVKLDNKDNWKKLNDIEIGMRAKNLIQEVSENDKKLFLMGVRKAIFSTINYMRSNFPYCNQILKDMDIFRPLDIKMSITHGLHAISRIAKYLHFSENAIDNIREEWKILKLDDQAHEILLQNADSRIDIYWHSLESVVNSNKEIKYRNLINLIKTALVLPHGNADPERGFSINNSMLKGGFNEHSIKSLRFVKDAVKNYGGVRKVPITTSLLNDVKNSHKAYQQYMEKQKAKEENLMKEKKQKEIENSERQMNRKRKCDMDMKINEIDANICHIKEEKNIALGLISEGTERLSKSIMEKNNVETTVASALISQATEQLKKLEAKLSEIEKEKAQILKKMAKCETK
jgi:hypothetical protein